MTSPAPDELARANAPHEEPEDAARARLIARLDQYVVAVVDNDPSSVEVTVDFRETQNAVESRRGEGIWASARGRGPCVRYADPTTSEAGFYGMLEELEGKAICGLRIKVDKDAVSEAEWIIAREGMTFYNPNGFVTNLPRERAPVDPCPAQRQVAIGSVKSYFDGVAASDGSAVQAHPDCYRIENGTLNVGLMPGQPRRSEDSEAGDGVSSALAPGVTNCVTGFENLRRLTEDVIDRQYFYDEQAGVVWAHGIFKRVAGAVARDGEELLWLNFFELFQIDAEQIRGIYATMNYLPRSVTSSGWSRLSVK